MYFIFCFFTGLSLIFFLSQTYTTNLTKSRNKELTPNCHGGSSGLCRTAGEGGVRQARSKNV